MEGNVNSLIRSTPSPKRKRQGCTIPCVVSCREAFQTPLSPLQPPARPLVKFIFLHLRTLEQVRCQEMSTPTDSSEAGYLNISTESRNLSTPKQFSVCLGAKLGHVQYKVIQPGENF